MYLSSWEPLSGTIILISQHTLLQRFSRPQLNLWTFLLLVLLLHPGVIHIMSLFQDCIPRCWTCVHVPGSHRSSTVSRDGRHRRALLQRWCRLYNQVLECTQLQHWSIRFFWYVIFILNPFNAKATFRPKHKKAKIFKNHLKSFHVDIHWIGLIIFAVLDEESPAILKIEYEVI